MIDWKNIKDLHANKKLEHVIGKWFGVDIFYTDKYGNIHSSIKDKDHEFLSHFFKVQMQLSFGEQYLKQDIEKGLEHLQKADKSFFYFDSFFPHVRMFAAKIIVDGEFQGAVFSYPYVTDQITSAELDELKAKFTECGASLEDTDLACDNLKKIELKDYEYLKELICLVAEEISTVTTEVAKREARIADLNAQVGNKYRYHNMIGKSAPMQKIYHLLTKISKSEATILIQGENGTGKEMVAKAIHYNSPRKDAVFMAVNCSAFNDNLLDSELFGHVKGAFTGAIKDKKGVFEVANGGTLFLDEIGDMTLSMQVKLLRVLQEGTFMPVGATSPRKVNVRVVAATNKPLKEMIAKGEFREDLYYRVNVINVALPALRERFDDIPVLMDHFLEKKCAESGHPTKTWGKKTLEKMMDYKWPGNVRELQNEVERLVVLAGEDKMITPDLLSSRITDAVDGPVSVGSLKGVNTSGSMKQALEELEAFMIKEGLKRCNYNKSRLAKELGISRASLITKVDKYGLDKRKQAVGE
ncbi:MAG: sigma 54-interacting transcriptional regulator [Bacteriovoracaceae bacterium]|jgi:transcriptional regulator with PAS, ATPase and Fis domain|nr:sigma 54-interacting transcriptional regulator [Bacteriovoracaceae bacterium]